MSPRGQYLVIFDLLVFCFLSHISNYNRHCLYFPSEYIDCFSRLTALLAGIEPKSAKGTSPVALFIKLLGS